jgi:hypothetical protein
VARILMLRILLQYPLIELGGPGVFSQVKLRIAEVVSGIQQHLLALDAFKGVRRLGVVAGSVQGHAPTIGILETGCSCPVFAPGESGRRLLRIIAEPGGSRCARPGDGQGQNQADFGSKAGHSSTHHTDTHDSGALDPACRPA